MDGLLQVRLPPPPQLAALFDEDFDRPAPTPKPEAVVVEPAFSAEQLAEAREAGWHDGHAAGLQEAADSDGAAIRQVLQKVAEVLAAEREAAAKQAEASAEAIARLLLASLAAAFPELCAQYGDGEIRELVRAILPGLAQEPTIVIRINQRQAAALAEELGRADPEIAARVQTVESDAMPPGDVRIIWRNGSATRNASAIWQQVAAVLMPADLLTADAGIKETIDG